MTHRSPGSVVITALLFGAVLLGCGGDPPPVPEGPLRPWDTVAVPRHIHSPEPRGEGDAVPRGRVGAQPLLELGSRADEDEYVFGSVRGAVILGDGEIVIADGTAGTLLYFDQAGRLDTIAGGPGEGPGEFTQLFWVGLCQTDSVFVYDARTVRLSVFGDSGEFVRSFPVAAPGGRPVDAPRCADGRLVARGVPTWSEAPVQGPWMPRVPIFLNDLEGATDSIVESFPYVEYVGRGGRPLPPPLAAEVLFDLSGDRLLMGFSDRYEIGVFGVDGRPQAVFGLDLPRRPVTPEDADAIVSDLTASLEGETARRFREFADEHMPEFFPYFDRVLVASNGDVWIRRHPSPLDDPHHWDVFEGSGSYDYRGVVEAPARFELLEVRGDVVLGLWPGEYGEDLVRSYSIVETRDAEDGASG